MYPTTITSTSSATFDNQQLSEDYKRIEKAIVYLEEHYHEQPDLQEIAAYAGLSEFHFQRLFARWVGISPKRFLQFLTIENAKKMLEQSRNILETTYQSGLSSPGRLYDLFVTCEAVTPGEYKQRGEGLTIVYGFHPSPFGECLLAKTERGICGLSFVQNGDRQKSAEILKNSWSRAQLTEDPGQTVHLVNSIFDFAQQDSSTPLHLLLSGTNFQIKVWEALLRVPAGIVISYEDVAEFIGMPKGARAVSRAVSQNKVAYLIPCHRVIRKMGVFGGYHWGTARKKAILGWEMAHSLY